MHQVIGDMVTNTRKSVTLPRKSTTSSQKLRPFAALTPPPVVLPQRVFLYLRITEVSNLPTSKHRLELHITHNCYSVRKLKDHVSGSNVIDLSDPYDVPTFSITIEQDNNEEVMCFCDNPLLLTLFEYKSPEETEAIRAKMVVITGDVQDKSLNTEAYLEPIAQSHLDIFQCFSKRRALFTANTYLFPIGRRTRGSLLTPSLTWQVYSLLPLLKELSFNNVVFITFESIYNASAALMNEVYHELLVDLSFESTMPNEFKSFEKVHLCSFSILDRCVINKQPRLQIWETLKDKNFKKEHSLGLSTECTLALEDLFHNLLGTEGVHFDYEDIDILQDEALVCNAQHRYTLTESMRALLEDVLAFNQQHMLMEVYNRYKPEDKLLRGVIDLSIFLYPNVNACRFAVELQPVATTTLKKLKRPTATPKLSYDTVEYTPTPTFATIGICLQVPLTVSNHPMSMHDPNFFSYLNGTCAAISSQSYAMTAEQLCAEAYRSFDEIISRLIDHIVRNQSRAINNHDQFYCCTFRNIASKVIELIACDFNKRFPTKTNREFTELMTIVFRELDQRMYTTVEYFTRGSLTKYALPQQDVMDHIIEVMDVVKHMREVQKEPLVDVLFEKIKIKFEGHPVLNFYQFLFDVETLDFTAARKYLHLDPREQFVSAGYFSDFMAIYIEYMQALQHQETANDATEFLFENLHRFRVKYPHDMEVCILLHCLYQRSAYRPGMEYARWKYEKLFGKKLRYLPSMPITRWEIYCSYSFLAKSKRAKYFNRTVRQFVQLGMYKFAEIVFASIGDEITDFERYIVNTTLMILQGDVGTLIAVQPFQLHDLHNDTMKTLLAQANGNLEYFRGNRMAAMKHYVFLVQSKVRRGEIQLALLRYGFEKMAEKVYAEAIFTFRRVKLSTTNAIIAHFLLGKIMYRLGRFIDAEYYFAQTAAYEHIPDVWAWLALVNLKMKENFKALECWMYAKQNPRHRIGEEVIKELKKISYDSVDLYVDSFY